MNGIEFEKETYKPIASMQRGQDKSLIMRMVFKLSGGKIQTEQQAEKVLLIVAGILIILSIYNFASSGGKKIKPSDSTVLKQKNAMQKQMGLPQTYTK